MGFLLLMPLQNTKLHKLMNGLESNNTSFVYGLVSTYQAFLNVAWLGIDD